MRIIVDAQEFLAGNGTPDPAKIRIVQVEKTPARADGTAINGRFVIPVVEGVDFPVTSSSKVWPISNDNPMEDPDVNSQSFAYLLASFPMYGYLFFNPFLTEEDINGVGGIDFAKTFRNNDGPPPPTYWPVRVQTGRPAAPGAEAGLMPTHTALLEANAHVTGTSVRPGLLVTYEIDISAHTGGVGADDFMLYWRLLDFEVSDDVASDFGATEGTNAPAVRLVKETDQEPPTFYAAISLDDGIHWCLAGRLEPVNFVEKTTKIRIAFINFDTTKKVYLANWAVMF